MDEILGNIVTRLKEDDIYEQTVIFFFSDHGDWAGDYGLVEKWPSGLDDCLTRIPMIVRTPGCARGHVVNEPVECFDIMPTTLDLAGVDAAPHLPGMSLSPLLAAGGTYAGGAPLSRDAVFLEYVEEHRDSHKSIPPWRAIRTERYCYSITGEGPWMLFDLEDDPYEQHNVVDDPATAGVRRELHERLMDHLFTIEDPFARTYQP
jgi:choline-sulfatase